MGTQLLISIWRRRAKIDSGVAGVMGAGISVCGVSAGSASPAASRAGPRATCQRGSKAMRWLLDRFWLKFSPTARRVGLIVIATEVLVLLLFDAVLVVLRFATQRALGSHWKGGSVDRRQCTWNQAA